MLYGTPPRAPASLLEKAVGATGQHRHPARASTVPAQRRRRPPQAPQRTPHLLTKALAALIILGVTGMIGFLIVADARRGRTAEASVNPEAGLVSRAVDPMPLTVAEVFPDRAAPAPYRLGRAEAGPRCRVATTGALGRVLEDHGCSQVVRAALTTPYGDYQVTVGLFNLADAAGAAEVDDQVRRLVETGDGSFAALGGGAAATADGAQVGWHAAGHYLVYSVVSHPNGDVVAGDDPVAARITAELVDRYLTGSVLGSRSPAA